jgi:outer membrane protein assembly factor BamD (BamD/ComL family)
MKSAVLALCAALLAPYQCATSKDQRPLEDTAPKALWILSERFQKEGDDKARKTTLQQIVEQYPGSRYASRARSELGIPDPEGDEDESEKSAAERAEAGEDVGSEE